MKITQKELALAVLAILLLAAYLIFFTDWFKTKSIHVSHTLRHTPQADRMARNTGAVITFGLDQRIRLNEIKVLALAEWQTNRHAMPLWHLVSDSNSAPVRTFIYGQNLRGMHPAIPGARARPLDTNETYRLLITAGKIQGQHDFHLGLDVPAVK